VTDYYNQIDVDTIRKSESTGLGLPIAWNLAKLMDGELTVTSEYGKGSVFSVRLRQGFVDAAAIGPELARQLRQFQYFTTEKPDDARIVHRDLSHVAALVVDDVESNLEVAAGMLRRYRMHVDCVASGQQAIDKVRSGIHYDLIFMDHMMPGMDGIEALRGIRAIGTEYARSLPIIALTANAIAGNEQRFLENDFQAFLSKPLDMWQLDAALQRFIPSGDSTSNPPQSPLVRGEEKRAPSPAGAEGGRTAEGWSGEARCGEAAHKGRAGEGFAAVEHAANHRKTPLDPPLSGGKVGTPTSLDTPNFGLRP
jgi:CheY-like chemotaxis protein